MELDLFYINGFAVTKWLLMMVSVMIIVVVVMIERSLQAMTHPCGF